MQFFRLFMQIILDFLIFDNFYVILMGKKERAVTI